MNNGRAPLQTPRCLALLERSANMVLNLDEDARVGLEELNGTVIAFEVTGTEMKFYLCPQMQRIHLRQDIERAADVTVRGSPGELLAYAATETGALAGRGRRKLEIIGDVAVAQTLQRILKNMRPDWEEALSGPLGDLPARKLANFGRAIRDYVRSAAASLGADAGEYLRYEKRMVPDAAEVSEFSAAAAELRDDAERLKQRLEIMERRLASTT